MADEPTSTATESEESAAETPETTPEAATSEEATDASGGATAETPEPGEPATSAATATSLLFRPPEVVEPPPRPPADDTADEGEDDDESDDQGQQDADEAEGDASDEGGESGARRRRRRGGRRRRKSGGGESGDAQGSDDTQEGDADDAAKDAGDGSGGSGGGSSSSRRRRKRRREGDSSGGSGDDPEKTVTRVRKGRSAEDEITAVTGSTRLEAKKQRRREGREAGRRRAPIVSEAEFLARRESVDRQMVIRQRDDLTQIGVLEDTVLVEHYVARESQTSLIGNVYLGRVQNVLPSMEAAFIDIGKGRNAVLYAGEVNWSALGHKEGTPRKIESVLSSGQTVLVQVTKDPVGHKGARLTSQISLAGRFLVYVPDGNTSGISRKLPDTERSRLKALLKEIVPESAGVIVRTAAEGAAEEELTRDVERLKARWDDIEAKSKGGAPKLLYAEPDLTLKVVRDLFTEDFSKMVIQGEDAWSTVQDYVKHVAPDLEERLEKYEPTADSGDVFAAYRLDEQIAKGLDRKVWLPSGGSLIIDRTEAMTVIDVNTGKFTGSGGNLEETVTKNNLEAAEEVVRQLRLRDIGGIIVIDFIDMVLESNRDLVLRRLVECLGRDRTRHQVAEVTSLGLVQMTRKRIGTGLVEAFSESCPHCEGRGLLTHDMPVEPGKGDSGGRRGRRRGGKGRGRAGDAAPAPSKAPTPADVAAMAKPPSPDDEKAETEKAEPAAQAAQAEEPKPEPAEPEEPKPEAAEPAGEPKPEAAEPAEAEEPEPEPAEPAEAEEPEPEPAEPAAEKPEEPAEQPEAPAEPEPPKVVTRTRRAARRPAGTPQAAEPSAPAEVPVVPAAATSTADPPKVVTRTRGRSATRQAGPPVDEAEASAEEPVEHVPIKKKGSRKR